MKKSAVIVAGGKGERMNTKTPKQFLLLSGVPILMHTINAFKDFDKIIIVLPNSQIENWNVLCKQYDFSIPHTIISGGINRFGSVKNGLNIIDNDNIVVIHDGVRPLISQDLINLLIAKTKKDIGVVPVISIKDSLRKVENRISRTISRDNIYKVQTPQSFYSTSIKKAYQQKFSIFYTDDASVFESNGGKIITIPGDEKNIKITTKADLMIAGLFKEEL
tara:strand:- start:5359 stop:6018 length:660 start_codon:yes stop_codon:yes gene_type:complete